MPGPFSLYQEICNLNNGINPAKVDPYVREVNGTDKVRIAYGSGSLVSGAATVNTGLNTILAIDANIFAATGFATGATECSSVFIFSVTTGAAVVKGIFNAFVTGAATISASGTGQFTWIAIGT